MKKFEKSISQRGLCWLSPEVLQQNLRGYNDRSDVYSLGITACEMANGVSPYIDLPSTELLINKLQVPGDGATLVNAVKASPLSNPSLCKF